MKRVITAASNFNSQLTEYANYSIGNTTFSVHHAPLPEDLDLIKLSMSEVHPYNEAEYVWARVGDIQPLLARFIYDGEEIDRMYLASFYDGADLWENEEQYFYHILESLGQELREFNRDIQPQMSHN